MTVDTGTETGIESLTSTESTYLNKLASKFAKKRLTGTNDGKKVNDVDFFKKIDNGDYNKENFLKDFEESLEGDDLQKFAKIKTDEEKKILFESFKNKINETSAKYEFKKIELNKIIGNKYELNSTNKSNISKTIDKLNEEEIEKLLESNDELDNFLKKLLGNKVKKIDSQITKKINNVLNKLANSKSEKLLEKIENSLRSKGIYTDELFEEIKTSLYAILSTIQSGEDIAKIDIKDLFSFGVFNNEEKKNYIKLFMPTISLKELVTLSIITEDEAKIKMKQEIVNFIKNKRGTTVIDDSDYEIKEYIKILSLEDIKISTNDFIDSHFEKLTTESESLLGKITKRFNEFKDEIKENLISEIKTKTSFLKQVENNAELIRKISGGKNVLKKFSEGNVIKIDVKISKDSNETKPTFIYLEKLNENGTFIGIDKTYNDGYNKATNISETESTYYHFYNSLIGEDSLVKNIEFLDDGDLKTYITNGTIKETNSDLGTPTDADKKDFKDNYLENEIEKVKNKKDSAGNIDQVELDRLEELKRKSDAGEYDDIEEELTFYLFKNKLDLEDPDGSKYGIEGVTFTIGKKIADDDTFEEDEKTFTLTKIDKINQTVSIRSNLFGVIENISFAFFLDEIKKKSCKRVSNVKNLNEMVSNLINDSKTTVSWKNFEEKYGKIQRKDTEHDITYNYFSNGVDVLKIGNIEGNFIQVYNGKVKNEGKKEVFNMDSGYATISIGMLENYIKSRELVPRSEKEGEDKEKEAEIKKVDGTKWGFAKWLFSNKSLFEIIKGVKLGLENFEHYLKESGEEHAAKVALSTWGKFLPYEIQLSLKSRVESAEKKHMDEHVTNLENLDSPDATKLIKQFLIYRNTEDYRKEAALVFMLKKYGNLYNKSALNEYKGSFIWFKSFTGRWDKDIKTHPLYIEVKKECETPDKDGKTRNFTEEELMYRLIKKQCDGHGYGGIHRRGRLHKEIEKLKKSGINEEIEDGYKKANDTRNPKDQLKGGKGELYAGSPANAIGRWKALVDRGDDMTTMNEIPFLMLYSGMCFSISDDLANKIKEMVDEGRFIPLARFMSYPKDMKLAIETIKIVTKKIQDKKGHIYKNIGTKGEELYNDIFNSSKTEKEKLEACEKFWYTKGTNGKTYGDVITKTMYMLADGDTTEDSDLSSLIIIEKEKSGTDANTLKSYYNNQIGYLGSSKIIDNYMSDTFAGKGLSGIGSKVFEETLKQEGGGFKLKDTRQHILKEIQNEIDAIKKRKYSSEENRKIHLKHYLKNLIIGVINAHQSKIVAAHGLFGPRGGLKFLNENWGITIEKIKFSGDEIEESLPGDRVDRLFNTFVENILSDTGGTGISTGSSVNKILGMTTSNIP